MLTYFLQVNICWLLFYAVYYALLSRETFFMLNRVWLVLSLLCGLTLPFVADYFAAQVETSNLFSMTLEPFVVSASALKLNLSAHTEGVVLQVLTGIYALGCVVFTIRFLSGLFLIFKLIQESKREKQGRFNLVFMKSELLPFSFFNFIFIHPSLYQSNDFQQIMLHEKTHVQQRHSFDVVFLEILNILFWSSPLIYFYKKSLRNVHEYLADEVVLRYNAPPQYGRLLLRQQQSGMVLSLTSNISNHFFSQIKKRILMMTRNKSKRPALIKYALAVPTFLILTAALASPKTPILAKTEVLSHTVVKTIDKFEKNNFPISGNQKTGGAQILLSDNQILISNFKNIQEGKIIPCLDNLQQGGTISAEEIQHINGLKAFSVTNGQITEYDITDFVLVKVPSMGDPVQTIVKGAKFNDEAKRVLATAKERDNIQFFNIKVRNANGLEVATDRYGSMSIAVRNHTPQYQAPKDSLPADINPEDIVSMNVNNGVNNGGKKSITIQLKNGKTLKYEGEELKRFMERQEKLEAEKADMAKTAEQPIFTNVEQNPEFPEGQAAMFQWLGNHIKYPEDARKARAEGTVYIGFVVEADGSITHVETKRDVPVIIRDTVTIMESNGIKGNKVSERTEHSLSKEAERVITAMPKWKPGKSNGMAVRVAYTLPIKFKLE